LFALDGHRVSNLNKALGISAEVLEFVQRCGQRLEGFCGAVPPTPGYPQVMK
jgi:hypothetical protein